MTEEIITQLRTIENEEKVRILLAVESGSRALGFSSTDSDYDVRFIYVRPKDEYLKLNRKRDVIELPINAVLDINGWDLDKALILLYKSNPTLLEWLSSPIIYLETDFANRLRQTSLDYFSMIKALYHYLSRAVSSYQHYLNSDQVILKKYFYVLRPILACRWILDKKTPAPMLFSELVASELKPELKPEVEKLLVLKMNSPEINTIQRSESLNEYITSSILQLKDEINKLPEEPRQSWDQINELFLSQMKE